MKQLFLIFGIFLLAIRLPAQTNEPVKLALISETDEASSALDVLTAQLSGNPKIHLLERDQIEKVYREQGMSAANRDDLKLGRILGVDGLLLLNVVRTPQATNLTARLIAVKPGVILTDGNFPWPLKDTVQWSESAAIYLNSFLPKLALSSKDAIPISVVNLRSAIQSDAARETERQLKLLIIQRLSQERQFFVLERQKMQLLGEEKNLNSDESAFWGGSYLLDGVVDQNGYSEKTVTINARLTPPKGGVPLHFEVSGSRTNLAEVINQLATKIIVSLKPGSTVKEWNASDEAAQFYNEAKWALKWSVFKEAQAASESAWALGKQDLDCAEIRVKSYMMEVLADAAGFESGKIFLDPSNGYNANNQPLGPAQTDADVKREILIISNDHPFGMAYKTWEVNRTKIIAYVSLNQPPNPKNIGSAFHALELYYEFSRNSSNSNLVKAASEKSNWKNSDWYNLGIEDLVAASKVLQNFDFVPDAQKPVADKLADLRALARSVAQWISQNPSVHDSYFVGNRIVTHDELANTMEENPNIYRCEVNWGCLWQETPEDEIEFYQKLMSSPVFGYVHEGFWNRDLARPRLIAWDAENQKRLPVIDGNFVQELNNSTNALLRMEAKAVEFADALAEPKMAAAFTNLFNDVFKNGDVLVNNNVEVLYLNWRLGDLVDKKTSGVVTDMKEALRHLYDSTYAPKLGIMDREYWNKTIPARQTSSAFEKQKEYLIHFTPYDFSTFDEIFSSRDYTKTQAAELQPLVAAYKSNLVAQLRNASGIQKGNLMGAVAWVGFLENDVNHILNPPAPKSQMQPTIKTSRPPIMAKAVTPVSIANAPEIATNVLAVNKSFTIPVERLVSLDSSERIDDGSQVTITAHHWFEGKLLLDFDYNLLIGIFEKNDLMNLRKESGTAIALFNPTTERWDVIVCPKVDLRSQNNFYNRTLLLHDNLFNCDGGQIRKYNFARQQWQTLKISNGNNYELFAVNEHLYAANGNIIFEITDDDKGTRILASTRRRPPVSALDTQTFGTPVLFEGLNHSLCVCAGSKIFTWMTNDWRTDSFAPPAAFPPEVLAGGVLFRQAAGGMSQPMSLSFLSRDASQAELYLRQKASYPGVISMAARSTTPAPQPLWQMPSNLFLANLPAAVHQSDFYLLVDHSKAEDVHGEHGWIIGKKFLPKNGYHAALLCFSKGLPLPQKLFLKFAAADGCQPLTGGDPNARQWFAIMPRVWMLFSDHFLFFGLENPRNSVPTGTQQRTDIGGRVDIWLLPLSKLKPAIAAQKQIQLVQQAKMAADAKQAKKNLLEKYDLNRDGVINSGEKEAALADPEFVESQLNDVDANRNGRLDAEELIYFDANQNKILERNEAKAIDTIEHLLAARLLKQFDADGSGTLDRLDFERLWRASPKITVGMPDSMQFTLSDKNHDNQIDAEELESFLKKQTQTELRVYKRPGAKFLNHVNIRQTFKSAVEFYWQQPENVPSRLRTNGPTPTIP